MMSDEGCSPEAMISRSELPLIAGASRVIRKD